MSQAGAEYIVENQIHITIATGWQSFGGTRGAWFDESTQTLIVNKASDDNFDQNGDLTAWALSLIVHEGHHLEQGTELSHSKFGEMEGWQVQFEVLQSLGVSLSPAENAILHATTLTDVHASDRTIVGFVSLVKVHYPDYWQKYGVGLATYPDYPEYCFHIVSCGPGRPWWSRLNAPWMLP